MTRLNPSFAFALPVLMLALAGCPTTPARDAGVDAPVVLIDAPLPDSPVVMGDTPGLDAPTSGRVCSIGGGCDIILQNCPTGQGCYLAGAAGSVTTACMPIGGTLPEGSACTGMTCADRLHCSGGSDAACRNYCCMGQSGDCPTGYSCLNYGDGAGGALPIGVCVPPADCTVVPNVGCGTGEACAAQEDGTLLCVAAGTGAVGATCGPGMGCIAGAACITVTMGGTMTSNCRAYCRMGMTDCMGTETCMGVTGIPAPLGICFPPATP